MAKRINTPFVTAVAAVCFMGALAVFGMSALKNKFFVRPAEEIVKEERQLAKKLVSQGRYGEAGDTITRAWFRDKNNKEVCLERGDILLLLTDELGHDAIDMARKSWENALGIDSHYKPALTRLLDSYVDQMEIAPSADTCGHLADTARRILKFDSDPRAKSYLQIAMIHEWVLGKAKTPAEIDATFANLRGLLNDDPSNPEVLFYLVRGKVFAASEALGAGRSDLARKNLDEARAALDKATNAFPKNAALNFRAFQGYVALADTERDMDRLPNPTIGLKTDSPRDLANKISSRLFHLTPTAAEKDLAAAEAVLRRARETVKDDDERFADFQYVAAEWARRNDRADEAEDILRKFHKEHPTDQSARLALCHMLALGDPAKRDEAIQILEQPVRRIGKPGFRKLSLRELESETLLDLTSLRVALYPTVEPARRAVLMAQIEEGYNKVKAIAVAHAIPVLRLEGLIDELKGQNVEAVKILSDAMALLNKSEPNNPIKYNMMFQLATVERLAGQNRSAEVHLKELVERFEKYDPARLQLAECYLEDRNSAEAAKHIDILERHLHDPQQTAHLNPQEVLRLKIRLAQLLERKDDVTAMYTQLAEVTFEDKMIKAQIAGTLKNFDETIRLLKEMEAMKPDQSTITLAIYQALNKKGTPSDHEIARQYLVAAIKRNPNDKQLKLIKAEAEHPMPSQPDRIWIKMQAVDGKNKLMVEIAAGLDALAEQNYAEAIKRARAADNIRPDDPATWDLYFQIYKAQQNWDAISDAVNNLSRLDADHAKGRMYRWTLAMTRGNYAEAIRVAKDLTSDRGNFGQSWMLLAEAMQANGEFHEALQYYEAALARQTTNVDAYKGMAICWENLSQRDRARDVVMQGVRQFPDDPTLRETLWRYEEKENPPLVVPKRRKMLDQNPDDPENYITLSASCIRAGEWIYATDPRQAKAYVNEALDVLTRGAGKFPDDIRVNRELANVLKSMDRFGDGVKVLRALAETPKWKGKPDPVMLLADFYARVRRLKEAEEAYRQAWEMTHKKSIEIELRLAGFLHQQGRYDDALALLKENDHEPRIVLQTLQIHIAARHTAQARKGLDEALKADPENPDLLNLDAGVWIDQLDYVEARKVLNHVLTIDPRNDVALFFQAMVELRDPITSDLTLARDNLALIVNRNPRNMQFKLLYVDSLIRINDLDLASVELDGAVRLDPFNRDIRLKLLDMQIRLKKWPQFEQTVQFAELNPIISDAIWYRAHAYGYAAQKRYPEAINSIENAISMDKTNNPAYQRDRLIILLASENYEGVIRLTDQWMSANHHEWWVYHLRALARVGLGQKVIAMEQFDRALKAADEIKNPDAWEQILSSIAEVDVDAAIQCVESRLKELQANPTPKVAQTNPAPPELERWQLHSVSLHMRKQDWAGAKRELEGLILKRHQLRRDQRLSTVRFAAECYQSMGDNDKAEAFYAEWLKEAPNDPTALNNFACLLAENPSQLERARTYSQKAYELGTKYNNPDPMINDTHGWILSQLSGSYANDGLDILEKLVTAHGEIVDARYHLALAYLKAHRNDDAVKVLTAALEQLKQNEAKRMPARPKLKAKIQETLDKAKKVPAGKAAA